MKKVLLYIFLIFFSFHLMAQSDCSDAVHPTQYRASILNCCIKYIKSGNIVVYAKDGVINEIEAVAINLNKTYFELNGHNDSISKTVLLLSIPEGLYEGQNYEYYWAFNEKENNRFLFGIVLSIAGAGLLFTGITIMGNNEFIAREGQDSDWDQGSVFAIAGVAGLGVGIPMTISNGIKKRKSKHAMEEIKKQTLLSFSISSDRIGLIWTL